MGQWERHDMRRDRFGSIIVILAWMASSFVTLGTAGAVRAADAPPIRVVLQPSDAQGNAVAGPGYFQVTANPGTSLTLYALVGNIGQKRATIRLVPVDARSGVYGGISYNLPNQKVKKVGSWVVLSRKKVGLAPGKASVVQFTLRVPVKVKPGQYVGALTAFVPSQKVKGGIGALQIQFRRVTAIVVTVPGSSFGRFTITKVDPVQRPQGVYVIVHIKNTGTMLLQGQGNLWVWKIGRAKPVIQVHLSVDTTVPQTTVNYPVPWTKSPAPGQYRFRVMTWWSGGKTAKTGGFLIKATRPCHPSPKHKCKG
jgi:hypothetical protein